MLIASPSVGNFYGRIPDEPSFSLIPEETGKTKAMTQVAQRWQCGSISKIFKDIAAHGAWVIPGNKSSKR